MSDAIVNALLTEERLAWANAAKRNLAEKHLGVNGQDTIVLCAMILIGLSDSADIPLAQLLSTILILAQSLKPCPLWEKAK